MTSEWGMGAYNRVGPRTIYGQSGTMRDCDGPHAASANSVANGSRRSCANAGEVE